MVSQEESDEKEAPMLGSNVFSNTITKQVNAMNLSNREDNSSLSFSNSMTKIDADVNPFHQSIEYNKDGFSHHEALRRSPYNNLDKQGSSDAEIGCENARSAVRFGSWSYIFSQHE